MWGRTYTARAILDLLSTLGLRGREGVGQGDDLVAKDDRGSFDCLVSVVLPL